MFEATTKGLDKVQRALDALGPRIAGVFMTALVEEAEIEMTEAKRRTPVRTGALRDSGKVRLKQQGSSKWEFEVQLAFGGPTAPYAVYVHENPWATHPVGQWKFLESTLVESAPYLAARVARRALGLLSGEVAQASPGETFGKPGL